MSNFHPLSIAETEFDASAFNFDWWKARVLHYIDTDPLFGWSNPSTQLQRKDRELFLKLYYTAYPLWPPKDPTGETFAPWNDWKTKSSWFLRINNSWKPPTTLNHVRGVKQHPKLALYCIQYTVPDARFLYWIETGIDICTADP